MNLDVKEGVIAVYQMEGFKASLATESTLSRPCVMKRWEWWQFESRREGRGKLLVEGWRLLSCPWQQRAISADRA